MPTSPALHRLATALTAFRVAPQAVLEHGAVLLTDHVVSTDMAGLGTDGPAESAAERAATRAARSSVGDRDDVHWGQLIHPGSVIWPVAIELGAEKSASGRDVLRAARVGYETMVRLAALLPPSTRPPYHVTALVAPAGAAAAASALLDPDGTVSPDALGHALSVAGGSSGALSERSGTRVFHRSHAVRTGIAAARDALAGLGATRYDLEHGGGVFSSAGALDPAELRELGTVEEHAMATTSVRVFPTNGWYQSAFEAARTAAREVPGRLRSVHVTVPASLAARSTGSGEAWNSLEAAVVAAASAGAGDPAARARLQLVTVAGLEGHPPGATVSVRTSGGTAEATVSEPLGHPTRAAPITELAGTWGLTPDAALTAVTALRVALDDDRPFTIPAIPRRSTE